MEMEQKDCSLKVDKLIEKHAWITSEKQLFGKSGTDYDFASRNPSKAREELEKLQTEQSGCVTEKVHEFHLHKLFLRFLSFHIYMLRGDFSLLIM